MAENKNSAPLKRGAFLLFITAHTQNLPSVTSAIAKHKSREYNAINKIKRRMCDDVIIYVPCRDNRFAVELFSDTYIKNVNFVINPGIFNMVLNYLLNVSKTGSIYEKNVDFVQGICYIVPVKLRKL